VKSDQDNSLSLWGIPKKVKTINRDRSHFLLFIDLVKGLGVIDKKVGPLNYFILNILDCSVGRVIAGSASFILGFQRENSKTMFWGPRLRTPPKTKGFPKKKLRITV